MSTWRSPLEYSAQYPPPPPPPPPPTLSSLPTKQRSSSGGINLLRVPWGSSFRASSASSFPLLSSSIAGSLVDRYDIRCCCSCKMERQRSAAIILRAGGGGRGGGSPCSTHTCRWGRRNGSKLPLSHGHNGEREAKDKVNTRHQSGHHTYYVYVLSHRCSPHLTSPHLTSSVTR